MHGMSSVYCKFLVKSFKQFSSIKKKIIIHRNMYRVRLDRLPANISLMTSEKILFVGKAVCVVFAEREKNSAMINMDKGGCG